MSNFENRAESAPTALTDKAVKAFRKSAGNGRAERPITGHRGMRIRARNGRAVWVYRFKIGGDIRSMALGDLEMMSPAEALTAYEAAAKNRASGVDPVDAKGQALAKIIAVAAAAAKKATVAVEKLTVRNLVRASGTSDRSGPGRCTRKSTHYCCRSIRGAT